MTNFMLHLMSIPVSVVSRLISTTMLIFMLILPNPVQVVRLICDPELEVCLT
jgi:hypothetical protein